jgi:hypothetical protein
VERGAARSSPWRRDAQEEPMPEAVLLLLLVEEEGVEPIVPVRGVREEVVDWLVVVVRGSSKVLRSAVRGGEEVS